MLWKPCLTFILLFKCQMSSNVSKWTEVKGMWRFLTFPPYLHVAGIPCVLDRLDPADVWDAPVKERAGLANKHTQSQRRPVWFCRRDREREEGGAGGIREMMKVKEREREKEEMKFVKAGQDRDTERKIQDKQKRRGAKVLL